MIELIDIGANLGHESFRPDFDSMLARAKANGVVQMVVTGADAAGSRIASHVARVSEAHPGLFARASCAIASRSPGADVVLTQATRLNFPRHTLMGNQVGFLA